MKGFIWAFILLVGLYAAYSIFRISKDVAPDFSVYYGVAKNALEGRAIYGDPKLFTGYGYPPFSVLPYLPFALLPYGTSQALWIAGSLASLVASVFVSFSLFAPKAAIQTKLIAATLGFLAFPSRFSLGMGQSNLIVLLLFLLSLRHKSGVLMGIVFILKPQLMILGLLLGLKHKWRMLARAGATIVAGTALAGFVFGWGQYEHYVVKELPRLMEFRGREIYYNQGIEAFVSRHGLGADIATIVKIILAAVTIWATRKRKILESIPIWISLILLVIPLSWQHHYVLLIPAFVYLWSRVKNKTLFWLSLFLISVNIADPRSSIFPFAPLVLSHVFLGNLFVFYLLLPR